MTIKKLKPIKPASASSAPATPAAAAPSAPPAGGATIADRFKLDASAETSAKGGSVSKVSAIVALAGAVVALAVSGVLTFVLYQHWDFLCNQGV